MRPACWRQQLGAAAERVVAAYLEEKGFAIVAHNLRVGRDELDVVARCEDLIVVVEVRTRSSSSWTTSFGSILPEKRRRVRRAARRLWSTRYARDPTARRLRIDAAAVVYDGPRPKIIYSAAAF